MRYIATSLFLTGVTILMAALLLAPAAGASPRLYWANLGQGASPGPGQINWIDLADQKTGTVKIPAAMVGHPSGLALNPAADRVYWSGPELDSIGWARLTGAGSGRVPLPAEVAGKAFSVALDAEARRIYVVSPISGLFRMKLDGNSARALPVGSARIDQPTRIALAPDLKRLFWINNGSGTDPENPIGPDLSWARLDGTAGGDLNMYGKTVDPNVIRMLSGPVIDRKRKRIYMVNTTGNVATGRIRTQLDWISPDGRSRGSLLQSAGRGSPLVQSTGLAFDPMTNRIYGGNASQITSIGTIFWTNLTGRPRLRMILTGRRDSSTPIALALLDRPRARRRPTLGGRARRGATLRCRPGLWLGDAPEANYYRAPRSTGIRWTVNGKTVRGMNRKRIRASEPGRYRCVGIATNAAGRSQAASRPVKVRAG